MARELFTEDTSKNIQGEVSLALQAEYNTFIKNNINEIQNIALARVNQQIDRIRILLGTIGAKVPATALEQLANIGYGTDALIATLTEYMGGSSDFWKDLGYNINQFFSFKPEYKDLSVYFQDGIFASSSDDFWTRIHDSPLLRTIYNVKKEREIPEGIESPLRHRVEEYMDESFMQNLFNISFEEAYKKANELILNNDLYNAMTEEERNSHFARITDSVVTSETEMLMRTVVSAIPVVGKPLASYMFASSVFGKSYKDALEKGNSLNNALIYASGITATELVSEEIFKGISISGVGSADGLSDFVYSNLFSKTGSEFLSKLAQVGIEGVGEGIEEVFAQFVEPFLERKYLHEDSATFLSDPDQWIKDTGDAFLGGMISGILGNSIGTAIEEIGYAYNLNKSNGIEKVSGIESARIHTTVSEKNYLQKGLDKYNEKLKKATKESDKTKLKDKIEKSQKKLDSLNETLSKEFKRKFSSVANYLNKSKLDQQAKRKWIEKSGLSNIITVEQKIRKNGSVKIEYSLNESGLKEISSHNFASYYVKNVNGELKPQFIDTKIDKVLAFGDVNYGYNFGDNEVLTQQRYDSELSDEERKRFDSLQKSIKDVLGDSLETPIVFTFSGSDGAVYTQNGIVYINVKSVINAETNTNEANKEIVSKMLAHEYSHILHNANLKQWKMLVRDIEKEFAYLEFDENGKATLKYRNDFAKGLLEKSEFQTVIKDYNNSAGVTNDVLYQELVSYFIESVSDEKLFSEFVNNGKIKSKNLFFDSLKVKNADKKQSRAVIDIENRLLSNFSDIKRYTKTYNYIENNINNYYGKTQGEYNPFSSYVKIYGFTEEDIIKVFALANSTKGNKKFEYKDFVFRPKDVLSDFYGIINYDSKLYSRNFSSNDLIKVLSVVSDISEINEDNSAKIKTIFDTLYENFAIPYTNFMNFFGKQEGKSTFKKSYEFYNKVVKMFLQKKI